MKKTETSNHIDYAALAKQARQERTQHLAQLVNNGWALATQLFKRQPAAAKPVNPNLRTNRRRI
ncbi:MAG: hypothetical protein KDJ52_34560 [Anaerolineae bacterium]|nr:hypothetical protein [Anaerolineae bacterium]